jgi:hypothetical protein
MDVPGSPLRENQLGVFNENTFVQPLTPPSNIRNLIAQKEKVRAAAESNSTTSLLNEKCLKLCPPNRPTGDSSTLMRSLRSRLHTRTTPSLTLSLLTTATPRRSCWCCRSSAWAR